MKALLAPAVARLPDALDPERLAREAVLATAVEDMSNALGLTEDEIAERFLEARPKVNSDEAALKLVRFHREAEIAHAATEKPAPLVENLGGGAIRITATGPGSPLSPDDVDRTPAYEPSAEVMTMVREGAMRYHLDTLKTLEAETPEGFGLPLALSEPEAIAKREVEMKSRRLDRSNLANGTFIARPEGPNRAARRAAKAKR